MRKHMGIVLLFTVFQGLGLAACSKTGQGEGATDTENDTNDTLGDQTDTGMNTDTDTSSDADTDMDTDTDTDNDNDADTDADTNTDTEANTDVDTDADIDADADTDADTDAEADADTASDTEVVTDTDTGADIETDEGAVTAIDITDTVLVSDIRRFGINLGGDNYWDSVLKKNRIKNGGFEGVMFRHIAWGPGGDDRSFYDWNDYTFAPADDDKDLSGRTWLDVAVGAHAWVLAGDRAYQADVIESVEHAAFPGREADGDVLRFMLADTGPQVGRSGDDTLDEVGMLIEKVEDNLGFIGQHGGPLWAFSSEGAAITTGLGDVPPGSTGKAVAVIDAPGAETAKLMYPLVPSDQADPNGIWRISFWAKGDGMLTIGYGDWGDPLDAEPVALTDSWQYFDGVEMAVEGFTGDMLDLHLSVTGGRVMLDDVAAYKEGDANPTAFRDELVALLKALQPGSLRYLFMGGSSVDNMLKPDNERMAVAFRREVPPDGAIPWPPHDFTNGGADIIDFNMHDFLTLAAEVGADPWYCVSGTVLPEEMAALMEYLSGPETTPYGQLRAALGHPAPWTDTFGTIHLEMGNEAWNWSEAYAYGGWNGPEYWSTLFNRARETLAGYGDPGDRIKLHIGAQSYNTWLGASLVDYHGAAADGYAIAPYVIHEMSAEQAAFSDEALFSWAFGWVWYLNTGGPMQANADMIAASGHDLEISVYEVNHHITGGDADNEARNKIVTSIGGALNVINHMLLMLERYDVRVQNFFSLFQESYNGVGLWGSVLSAGEARYRPTFQSLMLANRVLVGDMVQVVKSGADQTWHASFDYEGETVETDVPYLHAYATRDNGNRGLILLNLHRTDALPVRIGLPAAVAPDSATLSTLTAPAITANNEWGHDPEVAIEETAIADFKDGYRYNLAPHSMTVISWQE